MKQVILSFLVKYFTDIESENKLNDEYTILRLC